jgi:hypothetical protein
MGEVEGLDVRSEPTNREGATGFCARPIRRFREPVDLLHDGATPGRSDTGGTVVPGLRCLGELLTGDEKVALEFEVLLDRRGVLDRGQWPMLCRRVGADGNGIAGEMASLRIVPSILEALTGRGRKFIKAEALTNLRAASLPETADGVARLDTALTPSEAGDGLAVRLLFGAPYGFGGSG